MNLQTCFSSDRELRAVFSWLTRIGAGVKFGSRPIGWYQAHQCHCIDILKELGINEPTCRNGWIYDKAQNKGKALIFSKISPDQLYREADTRSRK